MKFHEGHTWRAGCFSVSESNMSAYVPSFFGFVDVDAPDWRPRALDDDAAPDTVRSPGVTHHPTMRIGLFHEDVALEDAEPETIRGHEIRAAAPRAERTFDPADYVVEEPAPSHARMRATRRGGRSGVAA